MSRYFLEVSYKGTGFSGFQLQENANSIQAEIEKAFVVLQKAQVSLTGSSRTDAGVHAIQNYFHLDYAGEFHEHFIYKMNAILPAEIVIRSLIPVKDDAHCRFDAVSREYRYYIYQRKDPFLRDRAHYFPYKLDLEKLQAAADYLKTVEDFTSLSKRRTQVKHFICRIEESEWVREKHGLIYRVKGNRFLRGMVRGMVATMLKVGRKKMELEELKMIIDARDCKKASFAVPPQGLFLNAVHYPGGYFEEIK